MKTHRAYAGATRQPRADRAWRLAILSIAVLALGWAAAQSTPVVSLSANRLELGGTLTLEATLLRPSAPYVFELGAPDGTRSSQQVRSNAAGNLRASQALDQAGRWSATLVGPGIEATFWVEVTPPPGARATTPRAPAPTPAAPLPEAPPSTTVTPAPEGSSPAVGGEAAPGAPASETPQPDAAQPDAAQPDAARPDAVEPGAAAPQPSTPDTRPPGQAGSPQNGAAAPQNAPSGAPADRAPADGPAAPPDRPSAGAQPGGASPDAGAPDADAPEPESRNGAPAPGAAPDANAPDTLRPGGAGPAPAPQAPTPVPVGPGRTLDVTLEGDLLVARANGDEAWRFTFTPDSGNTVGPVAKDARVYAAHGNSLLAIDAARGIVTERWALPAQASALALDGDTVAVTVRYRNGDAGRLLLAAGGLSETVRFDADPALFSLLRREAAVDDPAARLARDPTNPWLHVRLATMAATPQEAADHYRAALQQVHTFYDAAQLARVLHSNDQPELAEEAMDRALRDFAAREYRPELLTDRTLRDAYGFPLSAMEAAVDRGDLETAGFWAPWVYALSSPAVPETQAALRDYATALRATARVSGNAALRDQASLWRARAAEGSGFRIGRALESVALTLGRNGWYGVAALLVAIVALHVTLLAKYWRPQSLALRQRHEAGYRAVGVPRLFAMRYYSLTEKVVLVLMFAAVLALAGMAGWAQRGDDLPAAWRSGTLASESARAALATRLPATAGVRPAAAATTEAPASGEDAGRSPSAAGAGAQRGTTAEADFVRGYAAHTAGDVGAADAAYTAAGDLPGALNNLGVLRDDESLIQRALDLRPADRVARFNLGRDVDPSPFHAAYGADAPLLAVPTPADLRAAVAGSVQVSLAAAFTNPWAALTRTNPLAAPAWVWTVLVILFLLAAAATVLWLVVPRPRLARNAPRTPAYHVLALLLPGTGLSDELWGVLLLVPWAIFGVDALLHLLPGGVAPTMPLDTDYAALGILYALNLVAFIVEFVSYRRRMRDLRHEFPDTARAYGIRVPSSAG